ncbi:4-hydroxy-2-ketovalerate aldolase, partial [Salmonella enterica subsp. enterica serovar Typhi]|nr:4-hydroxy-2-ketovalerate aldolase [Salmonella enterica subsp. enterica serovar Typhi]
FHINEVEEAMSYCTQIKEKGYKVFVQPVGTTSYSDEELISLIKKVNELHPYAFYIVDTLGVMKKNDIHRVFHLVDHNLNKDIILGFHSHNNLQLSFSNAQELVDLHTSRNIIIDSSVNGMGRGAGNLNTELISDYVNWRKGAKYNTNRILEIVDNYIVEAKTKYSWGYSVPYYLAAYYNCHPDYATFIINKKTLQVSSIAKILTLIPKEFREMYDKALIEELYIQFQDNNVDDSEDILTLKEKLENKKVLIIVPGASISQYSEDIREFIKQNNPIIISVQFVPNRFKPDFVFFSNSRRFTNFSENLVEKDYQLIVTSNIQTTKVVSDFIINYTDYLNSYSLVRDNATLMLL